MKKYVFLAGSKKEKPDKFVLTEKLVKIKMDLALINL